MQRLHILQIKNLTQLFLAQHDRYPSDLDEFMTEIVKAYRIKLPELPGELKYGYDQVNHKLIIVD